MVLININEITLSFGGKKVFDRLDFQLKENERVALIGRNGAGKTTLMKVIAGESGVDEGQVSFRKGLTVSYLPQQTPGSMEGTAFDIILSGLGRRAELISEYHNTSNKLQHESSESLLRRLENLQRELDSTDSWETESRVKNVIDKTGLSPDSYFNSLSGGHRRRVLLAKALVSDPDVLLLDEPTNHLDINTIEWLEDFLADFRGTLFFVTHDRKFMDNLSTRISELDRGKLTNWECNYNTFLERKRKLLEDEEKRNSLFDKKLEDEEAWLRKGIKARRTRNEGRVKSLQKMRVEKRNRRERIGKVSFETGDTSLSGKQVILATNIYHEYDQKLIINNFSARIMRGDKVGIIGPNGCGKTTLLRIMLGELLPLEGEVNTGTNLEIAYFDQLREQLEEESSVIENVSGGSDFILIDDKPKHILSYLKDFLFSSERAHVPVKVLSGGERNRLLLARLFTRPFNLLVLDEPTNDLDIETLELLEDLLVGYSGTVMVVSHDREFLNNVVTSTLVFEGKNKIVEYPGGYDDWIEQRKQKPDTETGKDKTVDKPVEKKKRKVDNATRKKEQLSYKEKKELENFPERIAKLEAEQKELIKTLSDVNFYKKASGKIDRAEERSKSIQKEIDEAYDRWEELERLKEQPADP